MLHVLRTGTMETSRHPRLVVLLRLYLVTALLKPQHADGKTEPGSSPGSALCMCCGEHERSQQAGRHTSPSMTHLFQNLPLRPSTAVCDFCFAEGPVCSAGKQRGVWLAVVHSLQWA